MEAGSGSSGRRTARNGMGSAGVGSTGSRGTITETRKGGKYVFGKVVSVPAGFTRPMVISIRTVEGACSNAVGAFVVLNCDGCILTASHLLDITRRQQKSARCHRDFRGNVVEFHRDTAADERFRKKGVRTFRQLATPSVRNYSVWWGVEGVRVVEAKVVPGADLALGRLEPFDLESVPRFPALKDPARSYAPGRSLCKLKFPLHRIEPAYDEKENAFTLPPGAVPSPMFRLEGMFTRVVHTRVPWSEDGDPSLFGLMGGPVFNSKAVVLGSSPTRCTIRSDSGRLCRPEGRGGAGGAPAHRPRGARTRHP